MPAKPGGGGGGGGPPPAPPDGKPVYRVVVTNLEKGHITRHQKGIDEEDQLGYFFYDRGCDVQEVQLLIDTKTNKSRGFGFLDFRDAESLRKALALDGQEMKPGGKKIKVEVARSASSEQTQMEQTLADARNQTDELQRELALRKARVEELMREVERKRDRQHLLGGAGGSAEEELAAEKKRQAELQKGLSALQEAEQMLANVVHQEDLRTKALEDMRVTVDREQTRKHEAEEPSFHVEGAPGRPGETPLARTSSEEVSAEDLQFRIRNTFVEAYLPPPCERPHRAKTAPDVYHEFHLPSWGAGGPAAVGSTALPAEEGSAPIGPGDLEGAPPPPPLHPPWALRRDTSAAEVSRAILEDKMGAGAQPPPSASVTSGGQGPLQGTSSGELGGPPAAVSFAAQIRDQGPPARRRIRFKNVPIQPQEQLKANLMHELERLWKVALNRPPPEIESFQVSHKDGESVTYAQMARGTEAVVQFADWDDASWIVDGRLAATWSRGLDLSVGGRILRVEWAEPLTDWRRMRHQADTDASSHLSYNTVGTRQSHSGAISSRPQAGGQPAAGGAPAPATATASHAPSGAELNRTVVLEGLPRSYPAHQVQDEVVRLLQRLWRKDGWNFDPKERLHHGQGGGIVVRPGGRGEENNGTCLVKLRRHIDAKWLVEEADRRQLTVGGDTPVRVSWARPRGG